MADTTKTINTRIVLRHADLSAWEKSEVPLLAGEMAMARLSSSDSYIVRIGVGDKTWNELSDCGQLMIPVKNVEGLEEKIKSLSTSYYETGDIETLSSKDYVNGDIAVEKKLIAGEMSSYTAYRYDTTISAWRALDGNYSAENVYFKSDITLAGEYTQVGNITKALTATTTLEAEGKNVKDVMQSIFTKEIDPTPTNPTYSFSSSGSVDSYEVGNTYTVPGATFTFTGGGSYNFEPKDAAVRIPAQCAVVKRTDSGELAELSNTNELTAGTSTNNISLPTGSSGKIFGDSSDIYHFELTAYHTAGIVPKTNIGNPCPSKQIADGTWTSTATASFRGYRKPFWGYKKYTDTQLVFESTKISSSDIRGLASQGSSGSSTTGLPTQYTVPVGAKQIVFAAKAGVKSNMSATDANALNAPVSFTKKASLVDVEGYNGYTAVAYDVWYCELDSATGAGKEMDIRITWS